LDYGRFIYGAACRFYGGMLEPIQKQGLRLCLGAFRTSPADSLAVLAGEMPLTLRWEKLALQYAAKVAANPSNPVHESIYHPDYVNLFTRKPKAIAPFGIRFSDSLQALELEPDKIAHFEFPDTPPWTYTPPDVRLLLSDLKKSVTDPSIFKSKHNEIKAMHDGFEFIYTDGSLSEEGVAAAAVMGDHEYVERLPDGSSIFSAELHAIMLALDHVETTPVRDFVIFTDSKSVLQSIQGQHWENPLVRKILERHHRLCFTLVKRIVFYWIPSHVGIRGNEAADTAAKSGIHLRETFIPIPHTDFKRRINDLVKSKWQTEWDEAVRNKLHDIYPILNYNLYNVREKRREERVLNRLLIGHSHYTHSFLLSNEDPPQCIPCQDALTIKHLLIECIDFYDIRRKYFNVTSMRELFETVPLGQILLYLQEIGLYYRI
jgi:ribonuclease HI